MALLSLLASEVVGEVLLEMAGMIDPNSDDLASTSIPGLLREDEATASATRALSLKPSYRRLHRDVLRLK